VASRAGTNQSVIILGTQTQKDLVITYQYTSILFTVMPAGKPPKQAKRMTKAQEKRRKEEIAAKAKETRRRNREAAQRAQLELAQETEASSEEVEMEQEVVQGQRAALQDQLDELVAMKSRMAKQESKMAAMAKKQAKSKKKRKAIVLEESSDEESESEDDADSSSDEEVVITKTSKKKRAALAVQSHLYQVTGNSNVPSLVKYGEEEDDTSQSIVLIQKEKDTVARRGYLDFFKLFKRIQKNQLTAIDGGAQVTGAHDMPVTIWMRLWSTFMAEHIVLFPHEAFHMCKYQDFIVKLELEGADWRTYDATVRLCRGERAAKDGQDKNWNVVNQALYWKALQHKFEVRQQQMVQAAVRQEVPREAPVFKSAAPASKPLGNKPAQRGERPETKKYYSDQNVEMTFGQCWGFQYGTGCKEGIMCKYVETHQCESCGSDHSTRWCPRNAQRTAQNNATPAFVSSKPRPEHTATSPAEYQQVATGSAGYQPVQYQPVLQYQPVQATQVQYKPVPEMLAQLALPDKSFQGEERGAKKKSSSHSRSK
jgi:hypothetical protein